MGRHNVVQLASFAASADRAPNIVLVGMPGSGKRTLGGRLAGHLGMGFLDTDRLMERRANCDIQRIVDWRGLKKMRLLEESTILNLSVTSTVISTGGSAVYSEAAMRHLQSLGIIVYLEISLPTLLRRVRNTGNRGLVKHAHVGLPSLYRERVPLYQRWADVVVRNDWPLSAVRLEAIVQRIANAETGMQP